MRTTITDPIVMCCVALGHGHFKGDITSVLYKSTELHHTAMQSVSMECRNTTRNVVRQESQQHNQQDDMVNTEDWADRKSTRLNSSHL